MNAIHGGWLRVYEQAGREGLKTGSTSPPDVEPDLAALPHLHEQVLQYVVSAAGIDRLADICERIVARYLGLI